MKSYEKGKSGRVRILTLVLLILLSLLIHLLIFGTFLKYSFKHRAKQFIASISNLLTLPEKIEHQEKRRKKHEAIQRIFKSAETRPKRKFELFNKNKLADTRPAKLVAPKSNFGWVLFDTQHEQPEVLEIPRTKQGDVGESKLAHASEIKPIKHKSEPKESVQEETYEKPVKNVLTEKQELLPELRKGVAITATEEKTSADDVKKRIEQIEKMQRNIETYAQSDVEVKPVLDETVESRDVEPVEEQHEMTKEEEKNMILGSILRKNVENQDASKADEGPSTGMVWGVGGSKKGTKNIIKLTKGYVEKLHGENGSDLIDRDGDPNKRPTFEELKYISYESKINWCLQASWKDNFAHSPSARLMEGKAIIEFSIDEKGYLIDKKMLQSSGYREVDAAIMKNLEFATPFPPLPKHFGTKKYTTGRIITVYAHKFGV